MSSRQVHYNNIWAIAFVLLPVACMILSRPCSLTEFHQKMMKLLLTLLPAATNLQADKHTPDLCSVYPHVW